MNRKLAAVNAFIDYREPLRCKRTAMEIVATFSISFICFVVTLICMWLQFALPMLNPAFILLGCFPFLVGIVAFVIGSSLLWSFVTARIHVVQVGPAGVNYDGEQWPWESVISIRSRSVLHTGASYLSISVRRGVLFPLSLPIEVKDNDQTGTINKLKNYLIEAGYAIPWQSSVA